MQASGKLKLIWMAVGALVFFIFYFFNPFSLPIQASEILAVAMLMLVWWLTDALPMPVVALVPMTLFPLLGLMKIDKVAASYGNPVVFLFMGGFMIGLAMEKWNLHRRIALNIVKRTGSGSNRIILGFIIATAFLSMWLSNTATAMMMFPIALSVITLVENNYKGQGSVKNFSLVLMLCIAYAANVGGIATIIGTPPNVVLSGIMKKQAGIEMDFMEWMLFSFPLAIIILALMYVVLVFLLFPNRIGKEATSARLIEQEMKNLGKMNKGEKIVTVIFVFTALLWIFRTFINQLFDFAGLVIQLDDTLIALIATFLLFFIPVNTREDKFVLEWSDTSKLAWGILLLFGGGLCLADALSEAGLIDQMGNFIASYAGNHDLVLLILLSFLAIFLSELMSNVALVTVFVPVVIGIAESMGVNPLYFAIPVTLGASTAFMLPMGTPPNAIVFASGKIKISQMAKAGFVLNVISGIFISLFSYFFIQLIF